MKWWKLKGKSVLRLSVLVSIYFGFTAVSSGPEEPKEIVDRTDVVQLLPDLEESVVEEADVTSEDVL